MEFVDGHDLHVTEYGREQAAMLIHCRLERRPHRAVFADEDRPRKGNLAMIREHLRHLRVLHSDFAWKEPGLAARRGSSDFDLHTPLETRFLIEHDGRQQLAAGHQVGGKTDLDHRRSANAKGGGVDRLSVGMFAEHRRVEAPLGRVVRGLV